MKKLQRVFQSVCNKVSAMPTYAFWDQTACIAFPILIMLPLLSQLKDFRRETNCSFLVAVAVPAQDAAGKEEMRHLIEGTTNMCDLVSTYDVLENQRITTKEMQTAVLCDITGKGGPSGYVFRCVTPFLACCFAVFLLADMCMRWSGTCPAARRIWPHD